MSTTNQIILYKFITRLFSDGSLTKKASLNAIASSLDYGSRLIVGFLLQPILVIGLGDYSYGVWQILQRFIGYLTPASGRPAQALKMTLANQQLIASEDTKRGFVGSAVVVWMLFLPLLAILGGILTWFIPFWIKAPESFYWPVRFASLILLINLITYNLSVIPQSVMEGENLGFKRMGLSTLLVFVGGGLTWLAILLHTGLVGIAIAAFITTIITGLFYLWVVRSYAPWFGVRNPGMKDTLKFLGLSWWFLAWNLIMNLMTASDVVILGILLSVETVTDYSLSKYAPETLISIIAIMAFGIAPGLGGIIGSGDYKKARQVRGEMMILTWLSSTVLGAAVIAWNQSFIAFWVGPKHFVGSIQDLLIVLVVIQFVFIRNDGNVIDLSLKLRTKVLIGAASVVLSLSIAAVLIIVFHLGIVGLCFGLMAGRMVLSLGYPILVGRLLDLSFLSQVKSTIRPLITMGIIFSSAIFLDNFFSLNTVYSVTGWIDLGFRITVSSCIYLILAFLLGLSEKQRQNIIRRVKAVFLVDRNQPSTS